MSETLPAPLESASVLALLPGGPELTLDEKIYQLEAMMLERPQVATPLRHWFCNGMYAREFTVPAGILMTGAIHLDDSIAMMTKGRVRVINDDGSECDIVAPMTFIQRAGLKRIGLVMEEMVWTTIHACEATTVAEAERELITNSRAEFERLAGVAHIEGIAP